MSFPGLVQDVVISDDEEDKIFDDDEIKKSTQDDLFPSFTSNLGEIVDTVLISSDDEKDIPVKNTKTSTSACMSETSTAGVYKKYIEGVEVILPVQPYPSQLTVMSKVISALNKKKNCLVESPTGTGKTLALLCAALAWQQREEDRMSEIKATELCENHPELKEVSGAKEYIKTPEKYNITSPEKFFSRNNFGEKSIYFEPIEEVPSCINIEKRELCRSELEGPANSPLKKSKRNLNEIFGTNQPSTNNIPVADVTPMELEEDKSAENQKMNSMIESFRCETSMLVDCSLPVVYYTTRTHKQLEQVIKEFRRTVYCGKALMTILSSRDNSCLLSLDKSRWSSKNDMCRDCTKSLKSTNEFEATNKPSTSNRLTNCEYFDNRRKLNHSRLPPAFDLNDLINYGNRLTACPYYAARDMMKKANIVFCPYNYLVDPSIRNNLQLTVENNIVIIDEGHNIEDMCRSTATFNFTKKELQSAIKELNIVSSFLLANQGIMPRIESLQKYLNNWEKWFDDEIKKMPITDTVSVKTWEIEKFVQSLTNCEIGIDSYHDFNRNVYEFCQRLRENPRSLIGVTQVTGTFLESLDTVLGFLFRDWGQHMVDFKPVLEQKVKSKNHVNSWRKSQYDKNEIESVTLRLICLNPAVVFKDLNMARSIIIASGTLAPIKTFTSELGTDFSLTASPKHIISDDRVWVGSVCAGPGGTPLELTREGQRRAAVQDELGRVLLAACQRAPHGVLCFLPSYELVDTLVNRWKSTKLWEELEKLKDVIIESKNAKDHESNMKHFYSSAESRGALLLAVYRGKAAEGMDFKDRQARAIVAVGIPFPNIGDIAIKGKMEYNDRYSREKNILGGNEWLKIQAYRALNQAVGRCVRHKDDWGAVLLVDSRFAEQDARQNLPTWVRGALERNSSPTFETLKDFFKKMSLEDK